MVKQPVQSSVNISFFSLYKLHMLTNICNSCMFKKDICRIFCHNLSELHSRQNRFSDHQDLPETGLRKIGVFYTKLQYLCQAMAMAILLYSVVYCYIVIAMLAILPYHGYVCCKKTSFNLFFLNTGSSLQNWVDVQDTGRCFRGADKCRPCRCNASGS